LIIQYKTNMNKLVAVIALVLGLAIGFYGFNKYTKNSKGGEIFGIEFSIGKKEARTDAYIFMGLGGVLAVVGLYGIVKN